jgi:hypothetical protein
LEFDLDAGIYLSIFTFARDDFGYWFGCGIWIDVFVDRESAHDLVEISD